VYPAPGPLVLNGISRIDLLNTNGSTIIAMADGIIGQNMFISAIITLASITGLSNGSGDGSHRRATIKRPVAAYRGRCNVGLPFFKRRLKMEIKKQIKSCRYSCDFFQSTGPKCEHPAIENIIDGLFIKNDGLFITHENKNEIPAKCPLRDGDLIIEYSLFDDREKALLNEIE